MTTSIPHLMRRFARDWLDAADASVCDEIMAPDYRVEIGGIVFDGRDAYVPATMGQLRDFPGLRIVVHDFAWNGDSAMLRFTEHGPSRRHDGRVAAWRGIGLFWAAGGRLVRNVTEEDYVSRREQLAVGFPDALEPPLADPWSIPAAPRDAVLEAEVSELLVAGAHRTGGGVRFDDDGTEPASLLDIAETRVVDVLSAGESVGVRILETGVHRGGLGLSEAAHGRTGTLSSVGLLHRTASGLRGHIVQDRAGLRRALAG